MSEEEVKVMVAKVCEWLKENTPSQLDEYGEGVKADLARDFCYELLEAARANGMGGCLLCQG